MKVTPADLIRHQVLDWVLHHPRSRELMMVWTALVAEDLKYCPQGHPIADENAYVHNGYKRCRICHREQEQMRRDKEVKANASMVSSTIGPVAGDNRSDQRYYHSGEREPD